MKAHGRGAYALYEELRQRAERLLRKDEVRGPGLWHAALREEDEVGRLERMLRMIEKFEADTSYCRFTTPEQCRRAAEWLFTAIEMRHGAATAIKIFSDRSALAGKRRKERTNRLLRRLSNAPSTESMEESPPARETMEKAAERFSDLPLLLEFMGLPRHMTKDALRKRLNRLAPERKKRLAPQRKK